MPASKGSKTIKLRVKLRQLLEKKWTERKAKTPHTNHDFGGFVNDLLQDVIEKDEFLKQFAPYLSLDGYDYNTLFIFDMKRKDRIEIYRHGDKIKCRQDDSFDCEHVHFALAIPEIAKLGLNR